MLVRKAEGAVEKVLDPQAHPRQEDARPVRTLSRCSVSLRPAYLGGNVRDE